MIAIHCEICGKQVLVKPCELARGRRFCSRECRHKSQQRGNIYKCHVCGESVFRNRRDYEKSKTKTFFCSTRCRDRWKDKLMPKGHEHHGWVGGRGSYRSRALTTYGAKCHDDNCEITKAGIVITEKMLDVDHVDGDRSNNDISNLRPLCVWCHAKKSRKVEDTMDR